MKKTFKKLILAKYKIVIASKKDDYLKMVDNHEVVDFVLKHKLNDNWSLWYLRSYKKDPKVFSKENQDRVAHFSGMTHLGNVAKVRFEKETSFEDGLKLLEEEEKKTTGVKRLAPIPGSNLSQHKSGKKFIDLGNGLVWWDLGDGKSDEEAEAMIHCGNKPSFVKGDRIISLRKDVTPTHQEVLLTVIDHGGWIGEFKGKENYKPATKYHSACMALLLDKRIKGLVGGGYLPESNLQKEDLSKEDVEKIEKIKPDFFHPYIENLPKKKFNSDAYHHSKDVRTKSKLPLNATKKFLEEALSDEDANVRQAAIEHPNATKEQIEKALSDKDMYVRRAAIEHPSITPEQGKEIYKKTGLMPKVLLKSLSTKELISVMNRPTEENKDEKLIANAELAIDVLKERRKEDYEKRLPSMSDDEVNKYYQSVDEDVSDKAKEEWQRRK